MPRGAQGATTGPTTPSVSTPPSTPDEPWYPTWERQEPGATDPSAPVTGAPFPYRVVAQDDVLYTLHRLALQGAGRLLDSAGRPLDPRTLNAEEAYLSVQLVVDPDATASVAEALREMGAQQTSPRPSAPLLGSERSLFLVEVQRAP